MFFFYKKIDYIGIRAANIYIANIYVCVSILQNAPKIQRFVPDGLHFAVEIYYIRNIQYNIY